jgi:hypothetical protein
VAAAGDGKGNHAAGRDGQPVKDPFARGLATGKPAPVPPAPAAASAASAPPAAPAGSEAPAAEQRAQNTKDG